MVSIRCENYGFDCDFVSLGEIEGVISDYWQHMNDTHGIDYSKETIGKFITKKTPKTNSTELIIDN